MILGLSNDPDLGVRKLLYHIADASSWHEITSGHHSSQQVMYLHQVMCLHSL